MNMLFLLSHIANSFDAPIMGWSSWNTYRVNINESLIQLQADAMVSKGLKAAGYSNIHIDDGFFGYRDEKTGILYSNEERFPSGMKAISDYIRKKGLIPGIYSEAGANTCGYKWDQDQHGYKAGLYTYEEQDAKQYFLDWGFDFIKIDYCGAGQELALDPEPRYRKIRESIDKVIEGKKNVSINVCRWAFPGTWVRDIGRSWRIDDDISANWGAVTRIIGKNLYLSPYVGEGHYNDMDMLEVGRGLPLNQEEVHFGIWCIMSSPLLIGCDLTKIPDATLKLITNKELIALNQDPLGLQAYVVDEFNGAYVLVKDIEKKYGTVRAVALYNPTNSPINFKLDPALFDLEGPITVRDLIKQLDLGEFAHIPELTVPAESVKILRVEGKKRLEQTLYRAEWAYLNNFSDPRVFYDNDGYGYNVKRRVKLENVDYRFENISFRKSINFLGGEDKNYAEWTHYSPEGGQYTLKLFVLCPNSQSGVGAFLYDQVVEVTINNSPDIIRNKDIIYDRSIGVQPLEIPISLNPGENKIRIGSKITWTPDILGAQVIYQGPLDGSNSGFKFTTGNTIGIVITVICVIGALVLGGVMLFIHSRKTNDFRNIQV